MVTTSKSKEAPKPMRLDLKAPHQKYFHKDGKQVVGVTSYLGVLGKDALMPWAAKMEREGILAWFAAGKQTWDLPKPYFYAGATSKAADLGTIAHARIEAWLHGTTLDPEGLDPALYAASEAPLTRFQEWWDGEDLELVSSEEQLVHPSRRYGGTLDFTARRRKRNSLVLGDTKTTKANRDWPYPTVIAQVAAYRELYSVNHGETPDEVVVVRVGKTEDDLGQQVWLSPKKLDAGMRLFLAAKEAYEAQREL